VTGGPADPGAARRAGSADGAELPAVGSRSRSRLTGAALGPVALHCAVHATCPVLVVRPEPPAVAVPEQPSGVPARV
jgi:nucleotide-binding universal stress UspA family protein